METEFAAWPAGLCDGRPIWWPNPSYRPSRLALAPGGIGADDLADASRNWTRFRDVLKGIFPDAVTDVDGFQSRLTSVRLPDARDVLVKTDHEISSTGSIKGRGGVYEVLCFAERVAESHGLNPTTDPHALLSADAKRAFREHRIVVGSTGNLGFSVGVAGRGLGFEVEVHMSRDAARWKKDRLRDVGVTVVEHASDYTFAVDAARKAAEGDESAYFVDDENSITLLLGYSAAAVEIEVQLRRHGIKISEGRPLHVYIPCGVGGAPGGITLGLKNIFGPNVHCIFVEPVESPCMLVQVASGSGEPVSVHACGLSNDTIADGLAVAQGSMLVAKIAGRHVAGVATVTDEDLCEWVERMWVSDAMRLEPSGAAGFAAISRHGSFIERTLGGVSGTSIVWTTGGSFLPDPEWESARKVGQAVLSRAGPNSPGRRPRGVRLDGFKTGQVPNRPSRA